MAIKIYDPYDENSLSREFAVNDNLIDLFELTKSQIRMDLNRITVPDSDSCCFNSGKQNTQFLVDGKVKQTISLAITIDDSSICKLTKTLTIRYRYLMRNLMKVPVKLYQH